MKKNKQLFVTFDIAKSLREIGFDEECVNAYSEEISCDVPVWSQVIDWFRNEKQLEINVFKWAVHCYHKEDNPNGECEILALPHYIYEIEKAFEYTDDWEYQSIEDELTFHTYEEARNMAIFKAIEIIKTKDNENKNKR